MNKIYGVVFYNPVTDEHVFNVAVVGDRDGIHRAKRLAKRELDEWNMFEKERESGNYWQLQSVSSSIYTDQVGFHHILSTLARDKRDSTSEMKKEIGRDGVN